MFKQIYVFYDGRPFLPFVRAFLCEIVKITKKGFRIKNIDSPGDYEDVLFTSGGGARGWKTLRWYAVTDTDAERCYLMLRDLNARMTQEGGTSNE